MLNFEWLAGVPIAAARWVFLGLFMLINVLVWRIPADYVFAGVEAVSAVDTSGGRVVSALHGGGVDVDGRAYLATFVFRASADAAGVFWVTARKQDTRFGDSADQPMILSNAPSVRIDVVAHR